MAPTSPLEVTASAASSVKPPANTARRRRSRPLLAAQQVVGPVDRGPQRLVALDRSAAAAGQEPEALLEALPRSPPA